MYGKKTLIFLVLICAYVMSTEISLAKKAYVVKVIDGDSLLVQHENGEKVQFRFYGIDSPEYDQPYSKAAKMYLQNYLLGKTIHYTKVTRDKYGRYIVIVQYKGNIINEKLVTKGYAWVYPKYCKKKMCSKWKNLEKKAQKKKYGLWQEPTPVSPWTWRHK